MRLKSMTALTVAISLGCTPIQRNEHTMSKVEKKKLNGRSCIAVASSTAIKSKQTCQSLLLVPSIRKMSNTNNHDDGLILMIAATAVIAV